MRVLIKDFDVEMELKNNGVELEVRNPDGTHRGDLFVTKTNLIWCRGRTTRAKGVPVAWNQFIAWMESD